MRIRMTALVLSTSAILCSCVTAAEPPLSFTMEQVGAFSPEGWGAAAKDGERGFRGVQPGKRAWLQVPNWWGDAVRPPKGSLYVIEIGYKDTVKQPVSVRIFNAISSYFDASELHRIGGANDGQWKVAQVPVSWDLIMLPKGSKNAQIEFRAEGEAELPVCSITVRNAKLPEDRVRYEAQSRAWVVQVQGEKAKEAKFADPDQTPVLSESWQGKALVPFSRAYYDHVHANHAPQKGEAGAAVRVRMSQNEYEPGTFAVYAQEDLEGIACSLSDFKNAAGETLTCEVQLHGVENALQATQARNGKNFQWMPQRLWPAYPVNLAKGRSAWFYMTVRTLGSDKSKPGAYEGKVSITANGGRHTASLPVKIDVLPITLLTMEDAGLRMGGCCAGLVTAGEMQTMKAHNHNMVNLWFAGVQPEMKLVDGKVELEFYYLDDFMKLAKENGQDTIVWFLGGNPPGYPNTLTFERELYRVAFGSKDPYLQKQGTPEQRGKIQDELRPHYKKFIQDLVAHAKKSNWPELIFTPFDEPAKWAYDQPRADKTKYSIGCGPWTRDHFKAACALLHEAAPENKVYISLHHNNHRKVHGYEGRVGEIFFPDVDVVCTNAIDEDPEMGDKVRKLNKDFWQYGGGSSRRYGYGFYFAAFDSRGSLCWAYNWGSRLDITEGSNWLYAWYSPFDTILTPTYEEIREGWDDRRYLETVKALAKKKGQDISALITQIRTETLQDRGKGGRDLVEDFWEEGRTACKMDQWRQLLADKIVELQRQ